MERRAFIIIYALYLAAALAFAAGCASSKAGVATSPGNLNGDEFITRSRDFAQMAMAAKKNGVQQDLAEKGARFGGQCVERSPDLAGCYYWRAVNTGLYLEVHVIGYQRGVKQMISDCRRIIELDKNYDHAGAYRILGQIYTQLPQTGGTADSVVRDLPLAEGYLREAVKLAPDYPENYLVLAETLFAEEKFSEAVSTLANAKMLAPKWRHDYLYGDWQNSMSKLEKKIGREMKVLEIKN